MLILHVFLAILQKRTNFCDFLFSFLSDESLSKEGQPRQEVNPYWEERPLKKGVKMKMIELLDIQCFIMLFHDTANPRALAS